MDNIINYYQEMADKFIDNWCNENGLKNCSKYSQGLFNTSKTNEVAYSYLINYSLFLYNYEKANNKTSMYTVLNKKDLAEFIFKCKNIDEELIDSENFNAMKFFKAINLILSSYAGKLNETTDVEHFDTKTDAEKYFKDNYINFVDNGTYKIEKVYPMFDDIVGLFEAKKLIQEKVIDPILYKDIYAKYNVSSGGGILLYGLPGTGKTMFAQAVANEIDAHFVSIKSSDLKDKYYGETERKIKEYFDEARKYDVSVMFFDEFEAIGTTRDKENDYTTSSIVPELLAQIQGFEQNEKTILIIAATNRPWDIDSALLRPGRFDSLICIPLPDKELRKIMIQKNLKNVNVEEDILDYLAQTTEDYNGADIKKVSDSLVRIVINKEIKKIENYQITFEDCVEVLKKIKSSVSLKDKENLMEFERNR